jgi:anti-anti-sigma factor
MIAKHETGGPCEILRVSGRIDFESALDFEQQVNAMLQKGGDCFIIELSEVELLSSAGLRVLLSTAKRVTHRNAELALAAPSQVVRQVFEISHFNLLFKIFPSVNEAIAALKGAGPPKQPTAETTSDDANEETSSAEAGERPATNIPQTVQQPSPPQSPLPVPVQVQATPELKAPPVAATQDPQRNVLERGPSFTPAPAKEASSLMGSPPVQNPPAEPAPPKLRPETRETVIPAVRPPPIPKAKVPPLDETTPLARPPVTSPGGMGSQATPSPPAVPTGQPPSRAEKPVQRAGVARDDSPQPLAAERRTTGPPPVPPPLTGAETAVPIPRTPQPPPGVRKAAAQPPRAEASYPSLLELRAEGNSYPCEDGDVIGSVGRLASPYFSQIPGLAPRHLLIGKLEGRWFVFTPQNVQHPFLFDGQSLVAGERKFLQYAEHQMEFNGRVFGLRLIPEQKKQGFFSRIFGKK